MNNFKLCYIRDSFAFFTTAELKDQWGDSWNNAPYRHNAEDPNEWSECSDVPKYEIKKIAYDAYLDRPGDRYSVEMINAGAVAWLVYASSLDPKVVIPAGTTLEDFKRLIKEAGGKTYEESITTTEIPEGTSSGMLTFNGSPVYSEGGDYEGRN